MVAMPVVEFVMTVVTVPIMVTVAIPVSVVVAISVPVPFPIMVLTAAIVLIGTATVILVMLLPAKAGDLPVAAGLRKMLRFRAFPADRVFESRRGRDGRVFAACLAAASAFRRRRKFVVVLG
jgi:hypothetical protein